MFGCKSEEVIGKHLSLLLPNIAEDVESVSFESVGKRADGELFPVFLSKSNSSGEGFKQFNSFSVIRKGEAAVSAVFIRDVRDIREYQALIRQNEALLTKMLPKTIALRLKNSLTTNERDLIADGYDSVSILFADIVKLSCNLMCFNTLKLFWLE